MKYFLILFSFLVLSCNSNNKDYVLLINENNATLKNYIEEFKQRLKVNHIEQPSNFDDKSFNLIIKLSDDVLNFNDLKDYSILMNQLKEISKSQKITINLKRTESKEKIVLQNNLLLNLNNFTKIFIAKKFNFSATRCYFGNLIKYENSIIDDSTIIDFKTPNPFNIVIDSVIEKNKKIKYSEKNKSTIGQLKFKKSSNTPQIFGKIFYTNDNGEQILVQKINH